MISLTRGASKCQSHTGKRIEEWSPGSVGKEKMPVKEYTLYTEFQKKSQGIHYIKVMRLTLKLI